MIVNVMLSPLALSLLGIVGGVDAPADRAVVEVLVDGAGECTGSLVSPHVVVTAAHCVVEVELGTQLAIFTGLDDADRAGGVVVDASEAVVHADYNDDGEDHADIAALVLAEPVLDLEPLPLLQHALTDADIGSAVRVVGYGDNTEQVPTQGFGRRREGTTSFVGLDSDWYYVDGGGVAQCYGDSGGPVFLAIDGVETIIGVNSWQENDDCVGVNANTRVDAFGAFIAALIELHDSPDAPDAPDAPDVPASPPSPPAPPSTAPPNAPIGCHSAPPTSASLLAAALFALARRRRRRCG